jgi:hypothetical protein
MKVAARGGRVAKGQEKYMKKKQKHLLFQKKMH